MMTTVTVSPKYQIVIPLEVRKALSVKPGQKFSAMVWGDQIALLPVVSMEAARGMLKGLVNDFEREPDREL